MGNFKDFKRAIVSTYMCVRYPFLYPRNRWTGKHYNNWKLNQYHVDNYKKAIGCICLHVLNEKDLKEINGVDSFTYTFKDKENTTFGVHIALESGKLNILANGEAVVSIPIKDLVGSEKYAIQEVLFNNKTSEPTMYVVFSDTTELTNESFFHIYNYTKDKWLKAKVWLADILNDYILQWFHCIPTYNEWDAMKQLTGWNKAFGDQLLKDMKKQLIKDKMLFKFRITDIKEKYGTLRIYTGPASKEMFNLLSKYEHLSSHTCITCGKPAKYISDGWICPYCEEHIKDYKILATVDDNGSIHYIDDEEEESEE